jgi:hypothetical protein
MLQVIRFIFWILLFPSVTNEDSAVLLGGLVSLKNTSSVVLANTTVPDEIYTGNPEQPKAKDSPLPQDNRAKHQEGTPSTTHARQESKKEDSANSYG